jgi:hypothetical protein
MDQIRVLTVSGYEASIVGTIYNCFGAKAESSSIIFFKARPKRDADQNLLLFNVQPYRWQTVWMLFTEESSGIFKIILNREKLFLHPLFNFWTNFDLFHRKRIICFA